MPSFERITWEDTGLQQAFLRYVARVFPGLDFWRWRAFGGWGKDYVAHAVVEDGEVVANVSAMAMRLVVAGRETPGIQLGAVGCVQERRGRGLVGALMERVLAEESAQPGLQMLFANEDVLAFYPRFGFRAVEEWVFELERRIEPARPAPRINLGDRVQRAAWLEACARSQPVSESFGARGYGPIALWHVCNFASEDVRAVAEHETYVVAQQKGEVLQVLDLVAPGPFDLMGILPRLVDRPVTRVRFGFSPERWCPEAQPVERDTKSGLFVRGAVSLPDAPLRFPAFAQT
ncbi:MAG TPA: GNAT family N-acetyltransferase [Myxococcales bacterium]|jgi:hypothetical protein